MALLATLLLVGISCGYFQAGTWEDDPGNWNRAFGSTKSADVVVVHSQYWRSPHWTYEYQYFFQIAPNKKLMEQLFTESRLRRVVGDEAATVKDNAFGEPPEWFAPKYALEYDIWVFEEEPERNFKVLIDKTSGAMFLSDYQV